MLQIPEAAQWLPQNTPAILEARGPLMLPEVARELGLNETQVVEAVVRVRGERMELFLNGRAIEVPPGWRMSPGQTIWLTAHATTQGLWILRQHASPAIAQRALHAAAARAGLSSGASTPVAGATSASPAAAGARTAAPLAGGADTHAPPPDPHQEAAAARVARAKVVLQARSDGQDPRQVLAQQRGEAVITGGQLKPAASGGAQAQAPLAPDAKLVSAQEALAQSRGARLAEASQASTAAGSRPASPPLPGVAGEWARQGLPGQATARAAAFEPGGIAPQTAAASRPLGTISPALQNWPQWVQGRDGQALASAAQPSLAPSGAATAAYPKWANVWVQPAPSDWMDWQQASARVRELAAHPPGMQAMLQLFHPQTMALWLQNPALAQWAEWIHRDRLSMRKPDSEGIKAWVEHTLQPAEALLAKGQTPSGHTGADVRAMLGDLLRLLKAQGDAHAGSVRAALSDIEAAQLDHLRGLQQREWTLQCVLPFADAPTVQLQLQRDAPDTGAPGEWRQQWWVNLFTESEGLGQVWMRSGVSSRNEVEMQVWATRDHVVQDAQARVDDLRELLAEADLQLRQFTVIHGQRPPAPERFAPPSGAVLDQQA